MSLLLSFLCHLLRMAVGFRLQVIYEVNKQESAVGEGFEPSRHVFVRFIEAIKLFFIA